MGISIIGGADGPTEIFLAGQLGLGWINVMGLIILVLLLIPNIVYAVRFRDRKNRCTNTVMNVLEQIGRYGSMIFMIFPVWFTEIGFSSAGAFVAYVLGNGGLLVIYWVIWILFFVCQKPWKSVALAVVPTLIFLLSGVTLGYVPLVCSGVIFGVGHLYVTYHNL